MQRRNPHLQQQQATTAIAGITLTLPKQPLLHSQQQQQQQRVPLLSSNLSKSHGGMNGINSRINGNNNTSSSSSSSSSSIRIWVLLVIVGLLAMLISIFPEQRQMMYDTEQRFEHAVYETEQQIEHDVMDWLSSKQDTNEIDNTILEYRPTDADLRMQQQSSKWVDSEKKLKIALKVLVDRQAKGIDLGVPVLTRWLGDDMPVFYSTDDSTLNMGMTLDEWNKQIEQRYEQMRIEEDHWRQMITKTLDKKRG
jgi:hypothetical protein